MKKHTRWTVAAVAGALFVAPAFANTTDSASPRAERPTASGSGADPTHSNADPDKAPGYQNSPGAQGTGSSASREAAGRTSSSTSSGTASGKHASAESEELLQKLHAGNQAEIKAGQWMQQHAQNGKVKDFAKKMVKDHGDMDKDLQKFAQKENVSLTGGASSDPAAAKDQQEMHMMQGMPAAQAERHYMTMMVNDHQRDVSEVRGAEQQAKSSDDKDLAKLLEKTAKKMEDHLKDAQKIQRDMSSRQARTPNQ